MATIGIACVWLLVSGCTTPEFVLRIGVNPWPGYEYIFLAQERGFFKERGVSVKLVEFPSLSDCRRAYERGQVDGMATTLVEVLQAHGIAQRAPRIVYAIDYSSGADKILAPSRIADISALRGAKIGVELDSLGYYVLARALSLNGLKLSDVHPVPFDQISMEDALKNGELDAIVTYPPTSARILRYPGYHSIFSTTSIPGEVLDVIAIDSTTIREQRKSVEKFIAGVRRAVLYAGEDPNTAKGIMATREELSQEEFTAILDNEITTVAPSEQPEFLKENGSVAKALATTFQLLRDTHRLSRTRPTSEILDPSFSKETE